MYLRVEVSSNVKIYFIVVSITIMLHRLLVESAGNFWQPAEFKNVANPDFGNLKQLQNPGHSSLTAPSIPYTYYMYTLYPIYNKQYIYYINTIYNIYIL